MTRKDFTLSDDGTWFYVDYQSPSYGADLGRGGYLSTTRFGTSEGREYFIQARIYEDAMNRAADERDAARDELRRLRTMRGAWRNLKLAIRNYQKVGIR